MLDLFAPPASPSPLQPARDIVAFDTVYCEQATASSRRGQEILGRYPDARVIEIAAHDAIPALRGGDPFDWMKTKRGVLVLGVKKTMTVRVNGRSADFIAPSTSKGCTMACTYCYVARHKGHSNPVTVFTNVEDVARTLVNHGSSRSAWRKMQADLEVLETV
jgi:spore photoproduct lyase